MVIRTYGCLCHITRNRYIQYSNSHYISLEAIQNSSDIFFFVSFFSSSFKSMQIALRVTRKPRNIDKYHKHILYILTILIVSKYTIPMR